MQKPALFGPGTSIHGSQLKQLNTSVLVYCGLQNTNTVSSIDVQLSVYINAIEKELSHMTSCNYGTHAWNQIHGTKRGHATRRKIMACTQSKNNFFLLLYGRLLGRSE